MTAGNSVRDALLAAAQTISQMPVPQLEGKYRHIRHRRRARDPREITRQQAELKTLNLDEAAYKFAVQAQELGDLHTAASNYRLAAMNDFADSPLRLADTLTAIAERYLTRPPDQQVKDEELSIVTDAAHWYLVAYGAGELEADEAATLIEDLLIRHPARPQPPAPPPRRPEVSQLNPRPSSGCGAAAPRAGTPRHAPQTLLPRP